MQILITNFLRKSSSTSQSTFLKVEETDMYTKDEHGTGTVTQSDQKKQPPVYETDACCCAWAYMTA
jgi:hypothetical protein